MKKRMTGKADKAARKLKRFRLSAREADARQEMLFPVDAAGSVELKKPTREDPAVRKYIPPEDADYEEEFRKFKITDLRTPEAVGLCRVRNWADRMICGDALTCLTLIPSDSVACIVTSPPYWHNVDYGLKRQIGQVSYEEFLFQLLDVWRQCERVLIPNGKLCINSPILPVSKRVMPKVDTRELKNLSSDIERTILAALSLRRYSLYIWQKQTTEKMFGSYPYPPNLYEQNTVEFINVFVRAGKREKIPKSVKEGSRLNERQWMDLTRQVWWLYPEDIKRARHPAPFPESLPNRLISMYTFAKADAFPGDIVLDPFCGTGQTLTAAKRLGRRYIGIDLVPEFCLEAARRVKVAKYNGEVFIIGSRHSRPTG